MAENNVAENDLLVLANKDLCVAVSPAAGASVAYFKKLGDEEIDIMRPASEKALSESDASGFSMYPMVP